MPISRLRPGSKQGHSASGNQAVRAFTLVEMLTAIAVLAIVVLITASIMNSASSIVSRSDRSLNANNEARMVFDRMAMDFAAMVKRNDVYFQFSKQNGNDPFSFYSETPGFFSSGSTAPTESNLSLVSYQVMPQTNGSYQLERLGQGCLWSDISFTPGTTPAITAGDFHVLGSSVFRMETAFLVSQGNNTFAITGTAPLPGAQAFQNFSAVIVAIGVLDSDSEQLVGAGSYASLIAALPDFSGTQTIPASSPPSAAAVDPILSVWRTRINAANFASSAGIPAAAAQQVHIYQRIFYLK
jgi:prepilin-type N-terminal cleavage/methylation domain-containing protein